jgi:hypothetical protein
VSDDIFETMAVGMIGRFWPLVDGRPQVPVMHGAVRRDEDGWISADPERCSAGSSCAATPAGPPEE